MSLGLIGRKVGMTRLFTDEGEAIPVTVIDVSDNRVAQVKTQATDGYDAVQLAHGTRRASRVTKAMAGHFAKAGVMAGNALNEFRIDSEKLAEMKPGQVVGVDVLTWADSNGVIEAAELEAQLAKVGEQIIGKVVTALKSKRPNPNGQDWHELQINGLSNLVSPTSNDDLPF